MKSYEPPVVIELCITQSDIDMMMDRLDDDCSDPGSCNAVVHGLRDFIKSGLALRIANYHGRRLFKYGTEHAPLSDELCQWLDLAFRGLSPSPRVFEIELPCSWLVDASEEQLTAASAALLAPTSA